MKSHAKLDSPLPLLRTARKAAQVDLASACQVSPAALSNIERGRHEPSSELCERIGAELDCPPAAVGGADFSIRVTNGEVTIEEASALPAS
jgi:transcriptional regulator with XRE-family HTH domain